MLRFRIRARPRRMASVEGLGSGPQGRLSRLRQMVTKLIRNERIEGLYAHCDETRGYAERLITMAVRNGDRHKATMEMADYWLLEKDLIHKLFKVLAPRYQNYSTAMTSIYQLSTPYPGQGIPVGILELKGNPLPPVKPQPRDPSNLLSNILLEEARKEYRQKQAVVTDTDMNRSSETDAPGSSVDGRSGSSVDGDPGSSVDPPVR